MSLPLDRRDFLRSLTGGTALAPALVATRGNAAVTVQQLGPGSAIGLDLAKRCGAAGEHRALLAELEARLAAEDGAPGTTLSASAACPICGCPVVAYRDVK